MKTKEQKRQEAKERNAAWAELSTAKKLESLDKRGHAAKQQRRKLGQF